MVWPQFHQSEIGSFTNTNILVNGVEDLDGFFGINPALKFLGSEYANGRAAFVHATSFLYGRSHFDGQNIMETGNERPYETNTGWVGRAMNAAGYSSLAVSLPIPSSCEETM